MTQLPPTALEAAAKAVFEQSIYHGYNDEVKAREWTRTSDLHRNAATAAIAAYLAQAEKEGWVMVLAGLARKVTSIARRNEDAPEITELSTLLAAAQNGGE